MGGLFASRIFVMHYSNKRIKPTTVCVIFSRKITHVTVIKRINLRFIDAMFVSCNLSSVVSVENKDPENKDLRPLKAGEKRKKKTPQHENEDPYKTKTPKNEKQRSPNTK